MLPISLSIRNFLSYRDGAPTLRLEDVHVACLCGPNGHGKSALLDAITWVLWGRARSQRQEQLIHHGQDEMAVELVFDIRSERYRVARRYSRARKTAQSSLELGVQTGADDFRPITGDTIGATQAHLNRLISMDYETFVNSAFLMQGRADLFTMSTASSRKEVLAKVLGLGLYDRLEERAKLHAREIQGKLSASALTIDRLVARVEQAEGVRESIETVEKDLSAAQGASLALMERLERLREKVAQLERRQTDSVELDEQIRRAQERGREGSLEVSGLERRVTAWREAIGRAPDIERGFQDLQIARQSHLAFSSAAHNVLALQNTLWPVEKELVEIRARLERDVVSHRQYMDVELAPRASSLRQINQSLLDTEARVAEIDSRDPELKQAVAAHQELTGQLQRLKHESDRLASLGKETRSKLELLDHEHPSDLSCPLCSNELGPEGIASIRAKYTAEIEDQRARYRDNSQQAELISRQANEASRSAELMRQNLETEKVRLESERGRLRAQYEEAEKSHEQLKQATLTLAEMEARLENNSYAPEQQARAKHIRSQIELMDFNPAAVEDAEQKVIALGYWDAEHQALMSARARLDDDAAALERARARVVEANAELEQRQAARASITMELLELPSYISQRNEIEGEHSKANAKRDELQAHKGSLLHQMSEIESASTELNEVEGQRKSMIDEASAYAELALAFGKGGVQALLVEAAIPRLEDEANDLLSRMTDGRMSLKIETQRERKTRTSDEAVETLDIVIADELGTRAYEMFSGGERFRVDFALRIALSKLLAWRAGAPLPTLFIDEGFGTQDAEGRDRIIDVIKAIEDRFERILVITHLDEVKEAFPLRIEVTRSIAGSTFSFS